MKPVQYVYRFTELTDTAESRHVDLAVRFWVDAVYDEGHIDTAHRKSQRSYQHLRASEQLSLVRV